MSNLLTTVRLGMPNAAMIWLILVTLPVLALCALLGRTGWNRIHLRDRKPRTLRKRVRLATQARDLTRYAEEVAVAAQRAAATAQRHRHQWLTALTTAEEAWRAFETADATVRRLADAAPFGEPRTPRTPSEYAARERYLHQEAMAACTRRELSIYQLSDALAHRNGWDPRLHPADQEVVLRRAVRDHLAAAHTAAVERERAAWHGAEAAAVAARSLQNEAMAAAWRVARLRPRPQRQPDTTPEITQVVLPARQALRWQTAHSG